jgi:hypothetical protein
LVQFALAYKLACISFHGLRHNHVSALIAGLLDAFTVCHAAANRDLLELIAPELTPVPATFFFVCKLMAG